MQDEVINQCNCKSSVAVVYGEEVPEKEFCLKYEPNITAYHQRIECDMNVTERIRRNSSRYCPNCPMRCEHHYYHVTKSTATWPQPETVFDFTQTYIVPDTKSSYYEEYLSINATNSTTEEKHSLIQNWINGYFYRINIYFAKFTTFEIRDAPKVTMSDLLSNVGGVFGLWAGISVITGLEFIELITKLVMQILFGKKGGKVKAVASGPK